MAKIRKRGKTYQIDYFDPNGKRIRKSFKKRKDAEAELGKRVSLIAEGRYLDVKKDYKTTLKELLEKYEENFKNQNSFKTAKRFFVKNFREYFGDETLLANIRYVDIETYRNKLRERLTQHYKIRTDASVNREMSCLRHIFKKAVEWEMMSETPFEKGKSLMLKENNKRMRFLTDDEIDSLLSECSPYLHNIVVCALNTGMRRSEILTLKWKQLKNGFIYLRETKTSEPRQIPINDTLEEMFGRVKSEQNPTGDNVFDLKGKPLKDQDLSSEYVFIHNGKGVDSVKTAFNAAVENAGIQDFRLNDCRHTFASQVLLRGGALKDIQELLGHKTMTMTLRYAHLTQEHKRKAVNLLNTLPLPKPKEKQKKSGQTDKVTASKKVDCHKTVTFHTHQKSASL